MVRILGDMWSSWGPDIGTALAATDEINAEGSAAGAEWHDFYCYVSRS